MRPMLSTILLVVFYVFSPVLILFLNYHFKIVQKIGVVVIAYIVGIIAGNLDIIPENGSQVKEIIMMLTIPLAIPLLLFSANLKQWLTLAGKTALSMIVAIFSVVIMVFVGFFTFNNSVIPDLWKLGGLLIGVYTGGTPNLAALKMMLDVDEEIYLLTHTYDMVLSGIYFLFLISIGQRFFHLFLLPFKTKLTNSAKEQLSHDEPESFVRILQKDKSIPLLKAFLLSVVIFAIGGGVSLLVSENSQMVVVILIITTFGLGGSLIPKINQIENSFELGMFFILIFSVVVASMVNISELTMSTAVVLPYLAMVIFGSLLLHVVFAKVFKIDTDTVIVTSTALICSPPFVPVVAGALKNREIVVSGLTVGIIGYAIGNYLGFVIAQILKMWA